MTLIMSAYGKVAVTFDKEATRVYVISYCEWQESM